MGAARTKRFLVLSIQPVHAERIFTGVKHFEMRKALPKESFSRVFLYETGGRGITGCFDAGIPIKAAIPELWKIVGEKGTPKERFFAYFSKSKNGCAIPVMNPIQFASPICPPALIRAVPSFTAPMSFLLVQPGTKLHDTLSEKRLKEVKSVSVNLLPLRPCDRSRYVRLVTKEIAPKYDEITEDFARSILRSHNIGKDPNGIFTTRKRAFSILSDKGQLVGFTTVTYKIGGSVKTGPTVILPHYRRRGFGAATRRALLGLATKEKARKLYCTCPDNDSRVLSYLLRSGFGVEAHLKQQYTPAHGELVLGRFIDCPVKPSRTVRTEIARSETVAKQLKPGDPPFENLLTFFQKLFAWTWIPIEVSRAKSILSNGSRLKRTYEDKPSRIICFGNRRKCSSLVLLVPKRGGAVKALWFSQTNNEETLKTMLHTVENQVRADGKRKLYFVHPFDDAQITIVLKSSGYSVEGLLREPYRVGQDALVLSKILHRDSGRGVRCERSCG